MTTFVGVKTASFKTLSGLALCLTLLCVSPSQNSAKAQDTPGVPGTPGFNPNAPVPTVPAGTAGAFGGLTGILGPLNSVLGNLGSIQAAWGALEGLFSGDFSFTKLLDAACKSATAAEGVATSEESPDAEDYGEAKKGICGLSTFVTDVETRGDDIEGILESFSKNVFGSVMTTASALGADITPEQAAEWQTTINDILAGDSKDIPTRMQQLADTIINGQRDTARAAPNGTSARVLSDTARLAPNLQYQLDRESVVQGMGYNALGQSITDSLGSAELAKRQAEDTTMARYNEMNTEVIAPDIRKEARTAVSTRATVQEVVEAITRYMEQDSHNITFLSEQLTNQVQQQAYTNHQLHLMTQSMIQKDIKESQERQAQIQQSLFMTQQRLEGLTNQLTSVLGSFIPLGNDTATNVGIANGTIAPPTFTLSSGVSLDDKLNGNITPLFSTPTGGTGTP